MHRTSLFVVGLMTAVVACSSSSNDAQTSPTPAATQAPAQPEPSDGTPPSGSDPRDGGTTPTDAGSRKDGSSTTDGGGTRDSGGGGGTAAECTALDTCCNDLGSSMYPGCKSIVNNNLAASCANALQSYKSNGYCTGGTNCATLAGCCSQLPASWQSTCTTYVNLNNDSECLRLFGQYQTDGYCGGGPQGACTSLDACCQQVPSAYYSTCEYYVTANSQTDCATIHTNYRNAGYCN